MSRMNTADVVNAATLEKVVLTQRIAGFLKNNGDDQERAAIENVARMLAQDVALQVREALAFELRTCATLPYDLAAKIATDIQSVSSPFLASTEAFTDEQLAGLIPHLEEHAQITLSRRSDLGPSACQAIVTVGSEQAVSFVVRNAEIVMREEACDTVINRYRDNESIIQSLSRRADLPLAIVEQLVLIVSAEYQDLLVEKYGVSDDAASSVMQATLGETVWRQIESASPTQIHAYVIDLKKTDRLTHELALEIVGRGCLPFLESILALEAGLTLGAVRESLYGGDVKAFVALMQAADISKAEAQKYRQYVLLHGGNSDWPLHPTVQPNVRTTAH